MKVLTKEEFIELNKERLQPIYDQLEQAHAVDGEKQIEDILEHEYTMYLNQMKEIQHLVVQDDD